MAIKTITEKQRRVLAFLEHFIAREGRSPTYREAAAALELSHSSVFEHIKKLEKMGYLDIESRKGSSIVLASGLHKAPIVGTTACGGPISLYEEHEGFLEIPSNIARADGSYYCLRAIGESMKNAGIFDGDYLVVKKQNHAEDGEIAVVAIGEDESDEKVTLKRVYHSEKSLVLKPENEEFPTMVTKKGSVRGKLVGVVRALGE